MAYHMSGYESQPVRVTSNSAILKTELEAGFVFLEIVQTYSYPGSVGCLEIKLTTIRNVVLMSAAVFAIADKFVQFEDFKYVTLTRYCKIHLICKLI